MPNVMQKITSSDIIKVVNHRELWIAQGNSLFKWRFQEENSISREPALLLGDFVRIKDFFCNLEKNVLFVLEEIGQLAISFHINIYDLQTSNLLSTYRLDDRVVNPLWRADTEHGWISLAQSNIERNLSTVSIIQLDDHSNLKQIKRFSVGGEVSRDFTASNEIFCLKVNQFYKTIWGFFSSGKDLILRGAYRLALVCKMNTNC